MGVAYNDRVFLTGFTQTGKSTLARQMFLGAAEPRLVIDGSDSELTNVPGARSFSSVAQLHADPELAAAGTLRFVPPDPLDPRSYDAVCEWAFNSYPRYVWFDEVADPLPSHGASKGAVRLFRQGAKRMIGILGCSTRPIEVNPNVRGQAEHVIVFNTPLPEDRETLAKACGLTAAEFEYLHDQLAPHEFVWFERRTREAQLCPALALS